MEEIGTHRRTLTCNCSKQAEVTLRGIGCFNTGEAVEKTGWTPVFLYEGNTGWLCIDCGAKAKLLAKQLVEVVGSKEFPIGGLVKD